jgi:hypothetical protein
VSRWFRFYSGVVDDPKAQMLSPEMFKHWVNVLCIAAQHNGELPAIGVTAFTLRLAESKAAGILSKLHAAGLLDKTDKSFKPHNWDSRQYKHDASDPTNADRQKRYRDRKRNDSNGDSNGGSNGDDDVTEKRPEYTDGTNDRIGSAGASSFTDGSKSLASTFWKALGFESALAIHPDYAGTDWRAVEWEKAGWTVDLIDAETRRVGPDKPLTYYEKVFATAFAKRQAPLPAAVVKKQETVHVAKSARGGISSALDRLIEQAEGNSVGGFEGGQAATRLLSNG